MHERRQTRIFLIGTRTVATLGPRMHILIADDDRVLNHLMSSVFRKNGWTVSSAHDAMQVLMAAMRAPPDIILMDIHMPGGTGMQALSKLKASTKTANIPVLVLSGSINEAEAVTVMELGAAEYLTKPQNPETVVEAATRLTSKR